MLAFYTQALDHHIQIDTVDITITTPPISPKRVSHRKIKNTLFGYIRLKINQNSTSVGMVGVIVISRARHTYK